MKELIALILLLVTSYTYGQQTDTTNLQVTETENVVTFIEVFHKNQATKDGYYLGNYIVNITDDQARKLDGKKIKVSGKFYVVKGLDTLPKEKNKNGEIIHKQGRKEDTKHIPFPTIEIIDK
ncbi:MAG: hypothetical protein NT150_09815 [Bacteroidetes bacterium]|nr:hypothetical protein [Bacteroidota bacterium]